MAQAQCLRLTRTDRLANAGRQTIVDLTQLEYFGLILSFDRRWNTSAQSRTLRRCSTPLLIKAEDKSHGHYLLTDHP